MKIRQLTSEFHAKVYALLRSAFPESEYEAGLVEKLHFHNKPAHEWICIHKKKVIGYIAFSNAYNGSELCGLHLAPMAVAPEFQRQGVGSELIRFALRQEPIKSKSLFVLGETTYYEKFGFEPCTYPTCPFDKNNAHFLSMRNTTSVDFTVGYEPEFQAISKPTRLRTKKYR